MQVDEGTLNDTPILLELNHQILCGKSRQRCYCRKFKFELPPSAPPTQPSTPHKIVEKRDPLNGAPPVVNLHREKIRFKALLSTSERSQQVVEVYSVVWCSLRKTDFGSKEINKKHELREETIKTAQWR